MAAYDSLMVFTGNANPELAQRVVKHLDISLGCLLYTSDAADE